MCQFVRWKMKKSRRKENNLHISPCKGVLYEILINLFLSDFHFFNIFNIETLIEHTYIMAGPRRVFVDFVQLTSLSCNYIKVVANEWGDEPSSWYGYFISRLSILVDIDRQTDRQTHRHTKINVQVRPFHHNIIQLTGHWYCSCVLLRILHVYRCKLYRNRSWTVKDEVVGRETWNHEIRPWHCEIANGREFHMRQLHGALGLRNFQQPLIFD